jgi:hypothetical protein
MVLGFVNNIYEAKAHFLLCFFKTHFKFISKQSILIIIQTKQK